MAGGGAVGAAACASVALGLDLDGTANAIALAAARSGGTNQSWISGSDEWMLELGADVIEEFSRTQVSYGAARKFVWLTPITKTKALLTVDMWEEHHATFLRSVIPFRHDKYTHQIEVRTAADVQTVAALGWFEESAAWGRKER